MKRNNDQPLKAALQEWMNSNNLEERVNEWKLKRGWESLFGKTIAKYTEKISVRDKKLFLTITSASLKQELTYSVPKMIERINEWIGAEFIREVVVR